MSFVEDTFDTILDINPITGPYRDQERREDAAKKAAKTQTDYANRALDLQQEFTGKAIEGLDKTFGDAASALNLGREQAGLLFDEQGNIISEGFDQARGDIGAGFRDAQSYLASGAGRAESVLDPSYQQGRQAQTMQAALAGALGPQAQQQAYSNFQSSPGQQFLRDRQEQSILRNAAALGGGLGNQTGVMQALQENAAGLAAQDFDNAFGRLSQISNRGDSAASSIAALRSSLGQAQSGVAQNMAQILANLSTGRAGAMSDITGAKANLASGTQQGLAQLLANLGTSKANTYVGAGSQGAQLTQDIGAAKSGIDAYRAANPGPAQATSQNLMKIFGLLAGGV